MKYSVFKQGSINTLKEPMFFGNPVNVARYDQQKHDMFEKLIEKQISFFWRPEEVDVSRDRADYLKMTPAQRHIFMNNLKYQTLLDSVQGRSPNLAFLPIVSLPELETWVETWSFSETIHSRSYTFILRNVLNDPSAELGNIADHPEIAKRAADVTRYYDDLIELVALYTTDGEGVHVVNGRTVDCTMRNMKKKLYLAMVSVNTLEAVRFYVSFACTFAMFENKLMEGNAKIIRLIARDEALHKQGTQYMVNQFHAGSDDPEMAEIAIECREEALKIIDETNRQEKEWADFLFKEGSMMGLNKQILSEYVDFVTDTSMAAIGFEPKYGNGVNPLPWMGNYLNSDNVQVAPQETEISSYLTNQVSSDLNEQDFEDMGEL
ncbi:MAG: ribonucleotide-diphosphate reductase subunit beta [Planctomycetes bacterium]|nr:ribonucleotide-diphosphate reductase subunit beta [Planctomycetota bacterium]